MNNSISENQAMFKKLNTFDKDIVLLNEKRNNMDKKFDSFSQEANKKFDYITKRLDIFIEKADDRYAKKEELDKTNSIINRIGWIVISGVIVALLALIIN